MNTMRTYKIELPDGENVKFRVAKRTSNWTLVEVVLKNEKILDYLKHFAEVSEQKEQEQKEQKEKTQEKEENKSSGFSDKQIKEMQKIKDKMNIDDNEGLNDFVQDWSYGQGKSWKYLNKENINDFISYMKIQYLTE